MWLGFGCSMVGFGLKFLGFVVGACMVALMYGFILNGTRRSWYPTIFLLTCTCV